MKLTPYIVIAVALGLFLWWSFFKGCGKSSAEQKLQDSLNIERKLNDSIRFAGIELVKKVDSSNAKNTKDSVAYTKRIDSQKHVIAVLTSRFNVTRDSIGAMYANLRTFYLNHDTVALQDTYQRLQDQLTDANNQLFAIQISRDSSDNIRDAEIERLRGVIVDLQGQLATFNKLLVQCTENASNISKTAQAAINKAKRRNLLAKIAGGIAIVCAGILIL